MLTAPIPADDNQRLASLQKMNLLSSAREADLDRITRVAQRHFETEIALISLVDEDRQWFKSRCGLDAQETGRDISFCGHAILEDDTFVIEDTLEDERFKDNPLVTGAPFIRFYAGQPLSNIAGFNIGTLCVISPKAREFTPVDQQTLADLARMIEIVMENRQLSETQQELIRDLENAERDRLIDPLTGLWNQRGFEEFFKRECDRSYENNRPFGIGVISFDHFDQVEKEFGIEMTDELLKYSASVCLENLRPIDTVTNYENNQFLFLLPQLTNFPLYNIGEKLARAFKRSNKFTLSDATGAMDVSIGMVEITPSTDHQDLLGTCLNNAKEALRNAQKASHTDFSVLNMQQNVLNKLALA